MSQTQNVKATFGVIEKFLLTINKSGNGIITGNGIDCGNSCTEQYNLNTEVTLTANPENNYKFTGWNGACSGTSACLIKMTQPKTVQATFELVPKNLTIIKQGNGTITSTPSGISCGNDCTEQYGSPKESSGA